MPEFTRHHYAYVSSHVNQTYLVEAMFQLGLLDPSEIEGNYDPEADEYTDIYQWLAFPNFWGADYDCLVEAGIPVLDTDYGTWVGITSFGSPYDLYVYPSLINALFDLDIAYEDIERVK